MSGSFEPCNDVGAREEAHLKPNHNVLQTTSCNKLFLLHNHIYSHISSVTVHWARDRGIAPSLTFSIDADRSSSINLIHNSCHALTLSIHPFVCFESFIDRQERLNYRIEEYVENLV